MQDTLLIELLTEELPPKALQRLSTAFADHIFEALLAQGFVARDTIKLDRPMPRALFATPRRLGVGVFNVLARQPEQKVERKGPAVKMAFNAEGKPTQALLGFAKSCGVPVEGLEQMHDGKQACFVFRSTKPGQALDQILAGVVAEAVKKLPTPKLMRWGDSDVEFVRPVHGLVMLHGERVVPGEVLGLVSGNVTRGHRFLGTGKITLRDAQSYATQLEAEGKVLPDPVFRQGRVLDSLNKAQPSGASFIADLALLDEVTALVEWPVVYEGAFDPAFLAVPQECLILSMKQHQKYFPLVDGNGKLLPKFLVVSNLATGTPQNIIHGNERVLRARLSDAKFFFDQDRKTTLAARVPRLGEVVYHNKLGSQLERVQRIRKLAGSIASMLGADVALAERAAYLCKADLLTDMVGEFPELQGIMGMYYARHDGEPEPVACAIEAHYHPRFASDTLPADHIAASVALADKLDTLVGIYGVGLVPTGDKDPFALRRHALGVLRMLAEKALPLDVSELLELARDGFPKDLLPSAVATDLHAFMLERLRGYLREASYTLDEIDAVVSQNPVRIDLVPTRLKAVQAFKRLPEAEALAAANKRIQNILKKTAVSGAAPSASLLEEDEEKNLYDALNRSGPVVASHLQTGRFAEALTQLAGLRGTVDTFFDKVMVMTEDLKVRENRLALLHRLASLMNQVADISKLAAGSGRDGA